MDEQIPTLKRAVAALERARIPYALGGSMAAWARGAPAPEADLDLLVKRPDAERALEALTEGGMRPERPPEQWLYKAWDDDILVDLIFQPIGLPVTDELLARGETLSVGGVRVNVLPLEDILTHKLLSLDEHKLDFERTLQIVRSVREQIDWPQLARRTRESPYARAFFALVRELGIAEVEAREEARPDTAPRVRVA